MNKYLKLLGLNLSVIACTIICYSPGLLALSPMDASIFKAGMSIIAGLGLAIVFGVGNYKLLQNTSNVVYTTDNVIDLSSTREILNKYKGGKFFGEMASTALDQISRLEKSMVRVESEISRKFEQGSMSWDKYHSAVEAANQIALENLISLANRMQLFDEKEYARLKHYKDDNISDNIQEKQIELYKQNLDLIKDAITVNENLVLGLDTLTIELSKPNGNVDDNSLIDEIETLTKEVKYYV